MEAMISKVFVEHMDFHSVGHVVKHDGCWDLLLSISEA